MDNLNIYHIFQVTAESSSLTVAARKLYISQPAISKAIKKLEEDMSVTLFNRTSRGISLTEDGQVLYEHVKEAMDTLKNAQELIEMRNTQGIGQIRIGVSSTLCKFVLLPYLNEYIAANPNVKVMIHCQSTKHTLELIEQGKLNIGLIGGTHTLKKMDFYPLGQIQDTFVATPAYISNLEKMTRMDEEEIFESATLMLLDRENLTRQYIDNYLNQHHIEVGNLLEVTTMDLLIDFTKIGMGIGCVIREFVEKELEQGLLQELELSVPIHKRQIGFATPKHIHSKTVDSFMVMISQKNL